MKQQNYFLNWCRLRTLCLCAFAPLCLLQTPLFAGSFIFDRDGTDVFSFGDNASVWYVKNQPQTNMASPGTLTGFSIDSSGNNLLWTSNDSVDLQGKPCLSSDNGFIFVNDSTGAMVKLTKNGDLVSIEPGLIKVDLYDQGYVATTSIPVAATNDYFGFCEGRIEFDASGNQRKRFYLKDHLGSTRAVESEGGTPVEQVNYDAYGAKTLNTITGNENPAKEKFTGKEYDSAGVVNVGDLGLGLTYFGARYYDPEVATWIAVDPVKDGWFAYGYVNGNPIIMVDPTGEYGTLIGALLGIGSGAIGGALYGGVIGGIISSSQGGDFWQGFGKGALIGGIAGGAFGGIYGGVAGVGQVYQGMAGAGKQFVDLTWGLPNTAVGFTLGMADVGIGKIANWAGATGDYGIKYWAGQGMQLKGPLLGMGGAWRTVGPVVWGKENLFGDYLTHEFYHTFQSRLLGPLFVPGYFGNYFANAMVEPFVGLGKEIAGEGYDWSDLFWNAYNRPYNIIETWAKTVAPLPVW